MASPLDEGPRTVKLDLDLIANRAMEIRSWMVGHDFRSMQIRIFTGEEVPALIGEVRRLRNLLAVAQKGTAPPGIGNKPIEALSLGKRLEEFFFERRITTVSEILALRADEIRGPGVGPGSAKRLRKILARLGLALKGESDPLTGGAGRQSDERRTS